MDEALLICRIALAGVFVVAALAKAVDLPRTREAFSGLGVPRAVVPVAAILVPLAELAVAVALIPSATASAAAVAALLLLAAFTVLVAVAVARGTEAECHCFGNVSSRPVGPGTLARNAVLLAMAGFVVAGGAGTSATAWVADLSTTEAVLASVSVILALGVALNGAFLFQLFRQNGRLWAELEQLRDRGVKAAHEGLEIGEPAPRFALPDLTGRSVTLDDLLAGEDDSLMLLFTSPDCSACDPLLPEIGRALSDPAAGPRPIVIAMGAAEDVAAKCSEHGIASALLIDDFDLPRSLGIGGAPGAVVVDADGRIASSPAMGRGEVEELMEVSSAAPELILVEGTS